LTARFSLAIGVHGAGHLIQKEIGPTSHWPIAFLFVAPKLWGVTFSLNT
jgi:hypothetical protein